MCRFSGEAVQRFSADIERQIDRHRACIRRSDVIEDQLNCERIGNAQLAARRLAGPGADLAELGRGAEAVVLTDGARVFKVFDDCKNRDSDGRWAVLRSCVGRWRDTRALYPLLALEEDAGTRILVYPYEPSEPYCGGHGPGLVELLIECHRHGIACRNVHPKNLRVVGDRVRLVDYGADILRCDDPDATGVEFTTMCRRAFLSWRWAFRDDLDVLLRRSLREHDLPELEGFDRFLEAVRQAIGVAAPEDPLVSRALELSPRRVLDYGCGKGRIARRLADAGAEVTAYDPDPKLGPRLAATACDRLRVATTAEDAVPSGPFDLVICRRVACLVDEEALDDILSDLRSAVVEDGRVLLGVCHPVYAPRCPTPEARPHDCGGADPDRQFAWRKTVRATGRVLHEVHRPERLLRRLVQRAGFRIVGRHERSTVDLARFEPVSDLLVLELEPVGKPEVSLLIKACAMEAGTIGVQVRHLVSALEQPRGFAEVLLVLDSREEGFLRQHGPGDPSRLRREADQLVEEGWVDRIVHGPGDGPEAWATNERWLGIPSSATHAASGAQLASTLAGFDECRTPFLLHADADIMVGRCDPDHDYLGEMIDVLSRSGDAVTVGFNICHSGDVPWSSAGDRGPWRTESRIGLLHMQRLRAMLPLPGEAEGDRPRLAWHRTLDLAIHAGAGSSWRGGDRRTFFVHPPNERKHDEDEWFSALDRIDSGSVPPVQMDQVEWTGDARAWQMPDRHEPFVFVIAGRNVPPERFRRCFDSVLRQRRTDWGRGRDRRRVSAGMVR